MSSIEINTSDSDNDLKFATYNIHSRPKRTTQFNPINLNSLDTIILEESDESEDEDFLPNEESSEDIVNEPENCETNTDVDLASKQTEKLLKTENAKKMPAEEPTTTVKKKRKYKKRKQQPFLVDPQSDEETKKILNSFRNAKLGENLKSKSAKLLPKSKLTTKKTKLEKLPDTTLFPDPDLTCQPKVYAGPYIRCVTSSAAPMFMVYQSHSAHDSKFDVEAKKGMTIREKAPPITDQTIPWICSLCHTRPHSINGIGSLFGPYRVSLSELEEDQTLEYRTEKALKTEIEDSMFREVWLHEGCAVWTPNLFFIQNRLKGIWSVLESSSKLKCVSCKKSGATLMCNKHECKKVFHFPCALQNESYFNPTNFTIYCKKHTVPENQAQQD